MNAWQQPIWIASTPTPPPRPRRSDCWKWLAVQTTLQPHRRFAWFGWAWSLALSLVLASASPAQQPDASAERPPGPAAIRGLLLGDQGHHQPATRFQWLAAPLAERGIALEYTEDLDALSPERLRQFAVLVIYANHEALAPDQEQALLDFIAGGGGLVALHSASYCFRNSRAYIELVGGQFKSHGLESFRARIVDAQHPAMRDVSSFESVDETYLHAHLADDNRVLMVRDEAGGVEPCTWVRTHGRGRVFYTALGHDERTWRQEAFQRLVEQGIRWAARATGDDQPPRASAAGSASAEGDSPRPIPEPLSPQASMARMHLPEGFRVELVAAEPQIVMPLAMAHDHRGRLWVLESHDYPNRVLEGGRGNDQLKILEDADGDGRTDVVKIFAEGLNIPTGIAFGGGGVIVVNAPDILLLLDHDGDDRADERRVLYTGLGRFDTHAVASNLWYGTDNWIWGAVGYSGAAVESGGSLQQMKMGLFRFRPDGSAFEVLTATDNNTWGLGFTSAGDVLASTANRHHTWFMAIPNRHFERVRGWHGNGSCYNADHDRSHPLELPPRQWDHAGSFTAACNAAVYTAAQFPDPYPQRAMFVCEPTVHLIHNDLLVPQGSHLVARDGWNLMASDDPWCGPTQAVVGPDGAVWFIDLYSYVMLHNKPDEPRHRHGQGNAWLTDQRDLERARIYRIVYERAAAEPLTALDPADTGALLAALGHPNMFWRLTAQRLLVERGDRQLLLPLAGLINPSVPPAAARHALAALAGLAAADDQQLLLTAVARGLAHGDPTVRRLALAAAPPAPAAVAAILEAGCLADADAFVRRDALLAVAAQPPDPRAVEPILARLVDPVDALDRWIPLAAIGAAAANDEAFLRAAVRAGPTLATTTALESALRVVAAHHARGAAPAAVAALLADAAPAQGAILAAIVAGAAEGLATKQPRPLDGPTAARTVEVLFAALDRVDEPAQADVVAVARGLGLAEAFREASRALCAALAETVLDASAPQAERLSAARRWIALDDDPATVERLCAVVSPRSPPDFARGLVAAIGRSRSALAGRVLVEQLDRFSPAGRQAALSAALEQREWTAALLAALEEGRLAVDALSVEQRQRLRNHPQAELARRAQAVLARGGALPNPDRQQVIEALLPLASRRGDPQRGRQAFEKHCAKCHRHGTLGASVAPDLSGIAVRRREEILIDLIDPNRSVEGNYRTYTLSTDDGRVLSGLLAAETQTAVELVDVEGRRQVVLRDEIEELVAGRLSLMPEGFEKLPADELVDLLEFLTLRGRFLPLSLAQVANTVSTRGMFQDEALEWERLVFAEWGQVSVGGVPFTLIDPQAGRVPNALVLYSPLGAVARGKPRQAALPCRGPLKAVHLLGGVSGWGWPAIREESVSLIVRLRYADGAEEDHPLVNGRHLADYNGLVDVPESTRAFDLGGRQLRYLAVFPRRRQPIEAIQLVKGPDATAPVVMAVTVEAWPPEADDAEAGPAPAASDD